MLVRILKRKSVLSFALLAMSIQVNAQVNCKTSSLPFTVHSSSFLPTKSGLTGKVTYNVTGQIPDGLDAEALSNWKSMSVLDKLDMLNQLELGKKTQYNRLGKNVAQLLYKLYLKANTSAGSWYGRCDFWSSWSIDSFVANYISSLPETMVCKNIPITRAEVKELFTQYYTYSNATNYANESVKSTNGAFIFNSKRSYARLSQDQSTILNITGIDPFAAHDFDRGIQLNLPYGQGVVVQREKAGQIWNQPVFKSERCESQIDSKLLRADLVPAESLISDDSNVMYFLETQAAVYKELKNQVFYDSISAYTSLQPLQVAAAHLSKLNGSTNLQEKIANLLNSPVELKSILEAVSSLKNALYLDGVIRLRDDLRVVKVTNTLTYGLESHYAEGGNFHGNAKYVYNLIVDQSGQAVNSFWETRAQDQRMKPRMTGESDENYLQRELAHQERPGGLWKAKSVTDPENQLPSALVDLINSLGQCGFGKSNLN
jgi:hypothetical protein